MCPLLYTSCPLAHGISNQSITGARGPATPALEILGAMNNPALDAVNLKESVINEAGFCSLTSEEKEEANQIFRGICLENGWYYIWSTSLIE